MKTISRILTNGKILTTGGLVCLFGSFALADTLSQTSTQAESQDSASRNVRLNKSIVTAASGSEKLVKDAPASTTVISQEELQTMPYRDLAEAVRNVPGVEIDSSAGKLGGFSFLIRGMPADYTLLLVDGRRTKPGGQIATNNNGMESMYNAFMPPLSAIERIEVIRGPMSTLYGSDAMGGMVNIITKKIPEKWGATLSLEANIPESKTYQSTYQASFYAAGALSKKVGMNFRLRDLYRSEAGDTFKTNDGSTTKTFFGAQSNAYNIGTRLNYTPDSKNTFIFDVDYTKITFDNRKQQVGSHTTSSNDTLIGGYTDYLNVSKLVGLLGHDGDYSFGKWKTSLQYMDTRNLGRKVVGKYTADPDVGKNRDIIGQDIYLDSRLLLPLGDYNNLNIGAEYRSEQMHDRAANPNRFGFHTISAFVEDEWNIFEPFTITLGLRDTYNTKFGNHISPRIYGVLDITDSLTLKGGVSTGYKTPYTNQLVSGVYGYGSQGKLGFLGNPDLKPETSINYELGLVFDNDYVDFSVTGFRNNFSNKITSQSVTSGDAFNAYCSSSSKIYDNDCSQLYNADTAYTQGVESTFGIKPIYGVGFDISYVWTDTEVTSGKTKGQKLSFIPEHSLNAKVSYAYKDFSAYLRTEYKAKTPNNSFYSNTNTLTYKEYYKDYVVLTLGAQYRINDFVRLNAGIYNLLNHSFIDFDYVGTQSRNGSSSTPVYANNYRFILDGRRYWLNVTLDF
ncbi:TonB-dependent receptor [Helicobacter cinaedi]|uniref:TonB-dependent receptor domain-containing protein n=1 Tax=Helicobacter cinaedi TaxID=213 RepID=UPI0018A5DBF3|nr:TonB-dependent receptor [Helicobacter cinaedi]QOQ90753.1 TonB-dependent receptor [Helicobacter cinaedi]